MMRAVPVTEQRYAVWVLLAASALSGGCRSSDSGADKSKSVEVRSAPSSTTIIASLDAGAPIQRVVDDAIAFPATRVMGQRTHCPSDETPLRPDAINSNVESEQEVAAFLIDRRTVPCTAFDSCVRSGKCRSDGKVTCEDGVLVGPHSEAKSYCEWRGARLPSLAEWQRATRGVTGNRFPTGAKWDASRACERPTTTGSMRRCEHVGDEGVVYAIDNPNVGEWTGDVGCLVVDGQFFTGPVLAHLTANRLDIFTVLGDTGEFRCARSN
jgi:formylglycine-generating enzyme required for sulfatase activity